MNGRLKEAFDQIQADDDLKRATRLFLSRKTRSYTDARTGTRYFSAAVYACLLFLMLGFRSLFFTPTAEISIDINPSIALLVNRFDRVISVDAFNEDGRELSNALNIKYKNYADAIEEIINHQTIAALLSDNELMAITVAGSNQVQSARILSNVEACTATRQNTYCSFARSEEAKAAQEMGLSCGKYKAFLELQRFDPTITPDVISNMTMREIWDEISKLSGSPERENPPYGGGKGFRRGTRRSQ